MSKKPTEPQILYNCFDFIHVFTLNNVKKQNSITLEMVEFLFDRIKALFDDNDSGVILFKSAGKAFSAGGDLSSIINPDMFV